MTKATQTTLNFDTPAKTEPKAHKAGPITSTDPRKKPVVAAFKRIFNCRKVTSVRALADGRFQATCMNPNDSTTPMGTQTIAADEVAR